MRTRRAEPRGDAREEELVIERVVPGGAGLGRVEGRVALVSGALPGDRVRARLTASSPALLEGDVLEVVEAGPARRLDAEICPRALDRSCGGCDWPAVRPESAAALKAELVLDALRRVARLGPADFPEPRVVSSPPGYRLRNRLHVAGGRIGFYAPKSHEVADLASCEIVSPALLARLPTLRAALEPESRLEGELVTLESRAGDELIVELRPSAPYRDAPALVERLRAVTSGVRLLGPDGRPIEERGATSLVLDAGGARFRVSVSSFFQGNRHLLDAFLEEIRAGIAQSGVGARARSLDLYAGVGFLTRPLLEARTDATAVEIDASAAADLEANLAAWSAEGFPRARAVRASAEAFAPRALRERSFALVVADPPRAGISKDVRRALLASPPPALLLVSCDPATLARDLGELKSVYDVRRLTLLDLFPSTHHVETVALLVSRS